MKVLLLLALVVALQQAEEPDRYTDGSIWKKTGWNYKTPPGSLQKLSEGTCSVF